MVEQNKCCIKIRPEEKNPKPAPSLTQSILNPKPLLYSYKLEAALVWQKNLALHWVSGVSPEALLFLLLQKKQEKSLKLQTYRIFPLPTLSKRRALFSEKHHQNLFFLFSEWDKQDFLQSGMTQQHWGPQWFFALLSKQNYYSPGSRAAQTKSCIT